MTCVPVDGADTAVAYLGGEHEVLMPAVYLQRDHQSRKKRAPHIREGRISAETRGVGAVGVNAPELLYNRVERRACSVLYQRSYLSAGFHELCPGHIPGELHAKLRLAFKQPGDRAPEVLDGSLAAYPCADARQRLRAGAVRDHRDKAARGFRSFEPVVAVGALVLVLLSAYPRAYRLAPSDALIFAVELGVKLRAVLYHRAVAPYRRRVPHYLPVGELRSLRLRFFGGSLRLRSFIGFRRGFRKHRLLRSGNVS